VPARARRDPHPQRQGHRSQEHAVPAVIGEMTSDLERALSAIHTVRASQGERREAARIGTHTKSVYTSSVGSPSWMR
jgi:ABC-type multidrug transport system fused ATPase/permease subunit